MLDHKGEGEFQLEQEPQRGAGDRRVAEDSGQGLGGFRVWTPRSPRTELGPLRTPSCGDPVQAKPKPYDPTLESPRISARGPLLPVQQLQQPPQSMGACSDHAAGGHPDWSPPLPVSPFEAAAALKPEASSASLEGMAASPTTPLCGIMTPSESAWQGQCCPANEECSSLKQQATTPLTPFPPVERRPSWDPDMAAAVASRE